VAHASKRNTKGTKKDHLDQGEMKDPMNSDNAFNDKGLENLRKTNETMKGK